VHSVVTQEVIAIYAQKLNLHAVCQRAASGQLLFLGLIAACARVYWTEGTFHT
jgi:hypothetical protein